jgi:hypothetical protein
MQMNDMTLISVDDSRLPVEALATAPKSSGGARPEPGTERPVTSGDAQQLSAKQAESLAR